MASLTIYIDDRAFAALERCALASERTVTDLAEAAVEDAALHADPGEPRTHGPAQLLKNAF